MESGYSLEQSPPFPHTSSTSTIQNPIRKAPLLWPGVAALVLQWLAWGFVPAVYPAAGGFGVLGGLVGGLLILIWWSFFSGIRWSERLGALALIALALGASSRIVHKSIAGGMMGLMLFVYAIPLLSLALVGWAVAFGRLPAGLRRALLVTAILLACVPLALVRTDGITGDGTSQFAWRWSPTAEQQLLAQPSAEPAPQKAFVAAPTRPGPNEAQWPGFRGPDRDSVVHRTSLNTNWSAYPPVRLWSRPVGPGWSSFAVQDDLLFTQASGETSQPKSVR